MVSDNDCMHDLSGRSLPTFQRQHIPLNIGKLVPEYTVLQPRKQPSSLRGNTFADTKWNIAPAGKKSGWCWVQFVHRDNYFATS
jgi:hypothetical protein